MKNNKISKWHILYYWILTYLREFKNFFKRFTKKGREELAYEQKRLNQIHEMILHHTETKKQDDHTKQK